MSISHISSAMRQSLKQRDLEEIQSLIDNGENINAILNYSLLWTPLLWASDVNDLDIIRLLVESGADIDCCDLEGNTPLILATMKGHTEIVKFLLLKQANLGHKTRSRCTALDYAKREQHREIIELPSS